jgi:imidazole glycerol-phosphate synthase subunit HisF
MSKKIRLISRLDIKGPNVIKGIQMEGLRIVGKPETLAPKYYAEGADEILFIDTVASLYQRDNLLQIVRNTAENTFIPITAGGGVRAVEDVRKLLHAGADKVALNTAVIDNPNLVRDCAQLYGSQCIVLSVQAKKITDDHWEVYTDGGREKTGLDVMDWIKKAVDLGVGEILLTSVDRDGVKKGFDVDLAEKVCKSVSIPVIVSGGAGTPEHIEEVVRRANPDAVAVGSMLHYGIMSLGEIKQYLVEKKINVRLK